ncbi:myb-like protein X [Orussus abietinus]|uniref:myb-like protein X n=1 Tax=Orussus abietinus TaxID=222816 RepID=UPI000C715E09|nr:myb-like protein X [Orussus abietinus]
MTGRVSLLERKRLQWAKEREEMARLCGQWAPLKANDSVRTAIRTYPTSTRMSLTEINPKSTQPLRGGHYGSAVSLRSLETESLESLRGPEFPGECFPGFHENPEITRTRKRSPSLPPIRNKEHLSQEQRELEAENSRFYVQKQSQLVHQVNRGDLHRYGSPREEREGETSGYASDSLEAPLPPTQASLLPGCKMGENTWRNPCHGSPAGSLPPSRKISELRAMELNRPRWGGVWSQENLRNDPPPPSWLERGLSRLDHNSQVLVITHDSTSSPDTSSTGSAGSDSNKTYLRGQNIPVDADVLQEREARRQKALELQSAIKQQLEERDRQRKEEKERRLREEREEEERIRREREKEKERFEEEQRRLKEKEEAKQKKAEAMREVLEAAERLAREEKKQRRRRDEEDPRQNQESVRKGEDMFEPTFKERNSEPTYVLNSEDLKSPAIEENPYTKSAAGPKILEESINEKETKQLNNQWECDLDKTSSKSSRKSSSKSSEDLEENSSIIRLPVSKDVAIVLSGRIEDSEILNGTNVLNLVVASSPKKSSKSDNSSNTLKCGFNALVHGLGSPESWRTSCRTIISPRRVENRLLTPSKYRIPTGRDFGTQTNVERDLKDLQDLQDLQEGGIKDVTMKERKEATNSNRRDGEKSTSLGTSEDMSMKTFSRSKSQPRTSLESRPRWNANRPGTRYRTQSEKDPHYQRRLRLRRRQVETSDEGSRSPSLDRRKPITAKPKTRGTARRKLKIDSYDGDLSMDSLTSIVPLRIDKNGRVTVEPLKINPRDKSRGREANEKDRITIEEINEHSDSWCGRDILSQLASLRNGLLMKQREWDQRCLVSPGSEVY